MNCDVFLHFWQTKLLLIAPFVIFINSEKNCTKFNVSSCNNYLVSRTRRIVGTDVHGSEPFSVMTAEMNSCGVRSYKRSSTFMFSGISELSIVFCLPNELKKLLVFPRRYQNINWDNATVQSGSYQVHCAQNSPCAPFLRIYKFHSKQ